MPKKIGKYMMATKAQHKTGDISRDKPSLCFIREEGLKHYIGEFIEGYGFMEVQFPKETTRKLTDKERKYWQGRAISLPGFVSIIDLKGKV